MREIEINMVVTVPDEITEGILSDIFVGWVEGNGWTCGGGIVEVTEYKINENRYDRSKN